MKARTRARLMMTHPRPLSPRERARLSELTARRMFGGPLPANEAEEREGLRARLVAARERRTA